MHEWHLGCLSFRGPYREVGGVDRSRVINRGVCPSYMCELVDQVELSPVHVVGFCALITPVVGDLQQAPHHDVPRCT